MELLIVAIYAGILALVAPYVFLMNDFVGKLTPLGISLAAGSILWIVLTWVGFNYAEPWIWFIVMLTMPAVVWVGVRWLQSRRAKTEELELAKLDSAAH